LTIEGTSDFAVATDGYIILNTNTLNYEATPSFTFRVRFSIILYEERRQYRRYRLTLIP
jgi:hypothetical protein